MRRHATLLALCLAFSSHAAEPADPVAAVLERAEAHSAENAFGKAVRLLEPYESLRRADVDYALAYALYSETVDGKSVQAAEGLDISRAKALAERAAATGNGYALNLLYMMHINGVGLPVDHARALDYLQRAVAAGDTGAKVNYGVWLYRGGVLVGRDREQACRLFQELQLRPDPDPVSGYYLGLAMFSGECGLKQDRARAVELIEIAARADILDAQVDMGKNLEFGWAGDTDLRQALAWYALAADAGEPFAQWRIGMTYVDGEFRAQDAGQAVMWFERSAAQEHPNGLASLAVMYATGDGVDRDFARARALYRRAADGGNSHAYRGLALMHLLGEGGEPDPVRAWVLYAQAVAAGNDEEPQLRAAIESRLDPSQRQQAERELEATRAGGKTLKK